MEQDFAYVKKENGICILRCYGASGRVVIPRELEGTPVIEVSDYAFALEQEREPVSVSHFPCICGQQLEELYLPETIQRLGRYVFYNCLGLRKLSLYSNLAFMGAGAFTGCENLSHLEIHQLSGNSCLREILQDLKQKVTVDCYETANACGTSYMEPRYRLIYPEFFEEAVENTPARIISTQTHGMGIQYRNAFRNTKVIFKEYDRLFETGKYNIDLTTLVEMATARLRYPYELEEGAAGEYTDWLAAHLPDAAAYFLKKQQTQDLHWLAQAFVCREQQMDDILAVAKRQEAPETISMLMDVKYQRFPGKKKKFSL